MLDTAPPFDEALRHEAEAVRQYRMALASDHRVALALRPPSVWAAASARLDEAAVPRHRLRRGSLAASVVSTGPWADDEPMACIVQRWRGHCDGTATPLVWGGRVRLGRAAMTQLTEGGPLSADVGRQRVTAVDDGFVIERQDVDLAAAIVVRGDGT